MSYPLHDSEVSGSVYFSASEVSGSVYFSAKFSLRIPMGDEISIHLFCHSLGSRLRLLLRLVKVLLEFGFLVHAASRGLSAWLV
jgi:hypothetical protein